MKTFYSKMEARIALSFVFVLLIIQAPGFVKPQNSTGCILRLELEPLNSTINYLAYTVLTPTGGSGIPLRLNMPQAGGEWTVGLHLVGASHALCLLFVS